MRNVKDSGILFLNEITVYIFVYIQTNECPNDSIAYITSVMLGGKIK